MALIKLDEIKKMNNKAREEKIKELKLELVKANVIANKTNAKTKEIKRAIARLITFNASGKEVSNKK
jgi:ribosomal protein L29